MARVPGAWTPNARLEAHVVDRQGHDSATMGGMKIISLLSWVDWLALGWFFSPLAFAVAATLVVGILYSREFRSDVLHVLKD